MGGFFKRGEIVTVDDHPKKWCVDRVRETYLRDELVALADLSDEAGNLRPGVLTDRLTKVGG